MNQSLDHSEHLRRPDFLSNDAVSLVSEFFGIDGTAKELPGERDRNFLIQQSKGQRFVLKIFNQCESKELLEIQNEALTKTLNVLGSGRSPNLLANQNNDFLTKIESKTGIQHWLRLVGYVEGIPMAEYTPHNEEFLHHLGMMCGDLTRAVHSIEHKPLQIDLLWNMNQVSETLEKFLAYLPGPEKQEIVQKYLQLYHKTLDPIEKQLRKGWIQNDANDYNILVQPNLEGPPILGMIDFGDLCHSFLVADPAVAIAYGMLEKTQPGDAAFQQNRGYH